MKHSFLCLLFLIIPEWGQAQDVNKYVEILQESDHSPEKRLRLTSGIDSSWSKWNERGYSFGFNPALTPMHTEVNGILSTSYMVQVRGNENERNKKRWGFHVFEGYARDDKSRITLLLNKHEELGKPVAEMYYYGTEYNHSNDAYNWFRLGSDVRRHSYLFSRDKAVFYGSLQLSNALTLGRIGRDDIRTEEPDGDDEKNYEESARYVNFKELRDGGDGTMFYDKDRNIVVIKVDGKWMKLVVEDLPEGVEYSF